MSSYLARLRAADSGKTASKRTDKTDKSSSVSSVSTEGKQFSENGADDSPIPPAAKVRHQRVLAMLAERPSLRYALVTDDTDPTYPDCVVLGVGIRSVGGTLYTADLIVRRGSYDGFKLLELVDQHNAIKH